MKSLGVSLFETNKINENIFDRNFSISVSHVVIHHTQRPCKTGVGEGGVRRERTVRNWRGACCIINRFMKMIEEKSMCVVVMSSHVVALLCSVSPEGG